MFQSTYPPEEAATHQLVEILFDVITARFQFQHQIGNGDLSSGGNDIEQLALLVDLRHLLFFLRSLAGEKHTATDQREHDHAEQQNQPKDRTRTLEFVLVHSRDEPGTSRNSENCPGSDHAQSNQFSR